MTASKSITDEIRAAAESRAATLASIETGVHMLSVALHQLTQIDAKLGRLAPAVGRRLHADQQEVGAFVAEHLDRYLPPERREPPADGVRPLPTRVASARALESSAGR
jgi:hypothetical protein